METLALSPDLPFFFALFVFIYCIAYFIVFSNWTPKIRPEASSCLISLFHGTPAVFLATRAVLSDSNSGFASANTGMQNSVLEYSIAYFLTDLCHYLIFYPKDVLFIAHHVGTLLVFVTCRYVAFHGAFAILGLLVIAEVTSACQNTWTLAGARRQDSRAAAKLYDFLSPPFYAFYSVVRGVVGPYFVYRMVCFYASGDSDDVIPKWIWVSWIAVVVIAISVSMLWIWNLWVDLFRERNARLKKSS